MTAYHFFCQATNRTVLLPDLCKMHSNHTNTQPGCYVGGLPVLVAMLTQHSEAGVGAFNILYEITCREHLPVVHVKTVAAMLVRLRAPHRICHVLAACLPPVQGGGTVIPGIDGEPSIISSIRLPVFPSGDASVCPSICLSVHRPIHLSVQSFH